jgi:hypothetical protein
LVLLALTGSTFAEIRADKLVQSARRQIGVTVAYDPAYQKLAYPKGDVPARTGVCCDVVVRALREQGLDLQAAVHEDMAKNFSAYPARWGLKRPDSNIDHRRVPNLMTYFSRHGYSISTNQFLAGDIVTWDLGRNTPHIGIVSDRRSAAGVPLVIHNIGAGVQEEDALCNFTQTGHYRLK